MKRNEKVVALARELLETSDYLSIAGSANSTLKLILSILETAN